ncbi:MAG TPA: translation initiation factor IF-2 [Terriglobales bacterium]|nr:translation initiation factor IF-2 [Terriglobales bacterium]
MQPKIRINDLARELEVKSKAILDVLPQVGVTEKKTHSSSIEVDEAERVRQFFAKQAERDRDGRGAPSRGGEPEIKTKIDLSKISRPGDVQRVISQQAPAAPRPAGPAAAPPAATPLAPRPVIRPAAPPAAAAQPPAPATPVSAPPAAPASAAPVSAAPAAPAAPVRPQAPPPAPVEGSRAEASSPAAPPRRVIVPQTGPRPVYQAPTPQPGQPIARRPGTTPGQPIARAPGRPEPGKPIFQRPRPSAPGARPALRPGERRPMHPTTPRPMGGGPGMAPSPARPAGRPGAPSRRPGQRYVPRGVKEGPMKGFVPPPRLSLSTEPLPITRAITITEGISVKDLAEKLEIRGKDLITRLLAKGVFATINQTLDAELASEMARFFGAETNVVSFEEQAEKEMAQQAESTEEAQAAGPRPPVVTIMGHVDHGKTTLLDSIRATNVAGGEAGGITQHIGAYKVTIQDKNSPAYGRQIVFIDTPGHEAFTRMRARGAKVTDIVVLVVSADDGVMPQTLEAIDHAKAANVPIIVAVNKIDKPDAMPERVKKQLADRGLMPEDWGGTTVFVEVSAKQKTNLNLLMEMICLVADLQELKASPERSATGTVLEAKLDRGRGPVATVLVQNGTLRAGDSFVAGNVYGRVRAMFDDRSQALEEAGPSTPVELLGLEGLPAAGDQFVVADREKAKQISEYREMKSREAALAKTSRVSLEGLAEQIKTAGVKELPIILKGDVQGSIEVLGDLLTKLSTEKVKIKLLHASVGAITETDVLLASASNAIIIGFNVRPERKAQELAEQEKVDIRLHSIIYELQDEMKKAMQGLLEPTIRETYQGRAEVRETFRIPKVGMVAGCYVQDGSIKRDSEVRLLRDNVVVFKGKVASLRRFKEDVAEVRNGLECGISIQNYADVKVGDVIEAFVTERIAAEAIA